jgi:hypothetical protein
VSADRAPDLTGAWVARAEVRDGRLALVADGVRRLGLRFTAKVVFAQVRAVTGYDPRLPARPPELTGGRTVYAQRSEPGRTVLELHRATGPGEVDEAHFTITHGAVTVAWTVNAGQTARSWLGFYPLPRDR